MIDINNKKIINFYKYNNVSLRRILQNIFKRKIISIKYLGCNQLKSIKEYKFELLKFNIMLEDYKNYTIFLRVITKDIINQSLFCYWIFYKEYYYGTSHQDHFNGNIANKVEEKDEIRYQLHLINNKKKTTELSFINIIDLKKFKIFSNDIPDVKENNKCLFLAITSGQSSFDEDFPRV